MVTILMWIARLCLWRWLPGGKRARFYSINVMRARQPAWFREDLERLFDLSASGAIRPRVAERISFEKVSEAHHRLEAGSLEGKLVLCPDLGSQRERAPSQREPKASLQASPPRRSKVGAKFAHAMIKEVPAMVALRQQSAQGHLQPVARVGRLR